MPTLFEQLHAAIIAFAEEFDAWEELDGGPVLYLGYLVTADFLTAHALFEAERRGLLPPGLDEATTLERALDALMAHGGVDVGDAVRAVLGAFGLDGSDQTPPSRPARPRLHLDPAGDDCFEGGLSVDRHSRRVNLFRVVREPTLAFDRAALVGPWLPWDEAVPYEITASTLAYRYEWVRSARERLRGPGADPSLALPAEDFLARFDPDRVRFFANCPEDGPNTYQEGNESGTWWTAALLITDGARLGYLVGWEVDWR